MYGLQSLKDDQQYLFSYLRCCGFFNGFTPIKSKWIHLAHVSYHINPLYKCYVHLGNFIVLLVYLPISQSRSLILLFSQQISFSQSAWGCRGPRHEEPIKWFSKFWRFRFPLDSSYRILNAKSLHFLLKAKRPPSHIIFLKEITVDFCIGKESP